MGPIVVCQYGVCSVYTTDLVAVILGLIHERQRLAHDIAIVDDGERVLGRHVAKDGVVHAHQRVADVHSLCVRCVRCVEDMGEGGGGQKC